MSKRHHDIAQQQDDNMQPEGLPAAPQPGHDKHRPPVELVDKHPEAHRRETLIVAYDDEVTFQGGAATVKDAEHPMDELLRYQQLRDRNPPSRRSRRHEMQD